MDQEFNPIPHRFEIGMDNFFGISIVGKHVVHIFFACSAIVSLLSCAKLA